MFYHTGAIFLTDSNEQIFCGNQEFFSHFPELKDYPVPCDFSSFLQKYEKDYSIFRISTNNLDLTAYGKEREIPLPFFQKTQNFQNYLHIYLLVNKSDDFFEKVLEHLHDCVFVCDENGIVLYVNKTFEKYYGIQRNEIIGQMGINFLGNNQCSPSPIPMVLKEKRTITMEQITYVNRKITITAVPVFDENKNIEMIVENSRDITEIGMLKETLKEMSLLTEQYKMAIMQLGDVKPTDKLIANSNSMKKIMENLPRAASVDSTIMLLGESGTGKSNMAKYIHSISKRHEKPFITINCSTIPEQLFESELFGYLPGTFTGANKNGKIGLVELADSGTLFLDEVGELPPLIQTKMLQLIQEHTFTPVGGTKEKSIDIRIIAATNQNLESLVQQKLFREDLYYRLKVIEFHLPPLRERKEDILVLIYHFLNLFDKKYNYSHSLQKETIEILQSYRWPGNIRELSNVIENLVVMVGNKEIVPSDLPPSMYTNENHWRKPNISNIISLKNELEKLEKDIIIEAYKELKSTYKVANVLGISQSQASRKIKKYCQYIDISAELE